MPRPLSFVITCSTCQSCQDKVKGRRILRHLYRSKVVLYVLDTASEADGERDLLKEFLALRSEVHRYSPANALKRELVRIFVAASSRIT